MSATRPEELLSQLDRQDIGVSIDDPEARVPTITCECQEHNGEPIREGESSVLLLTREKDGWEVEKTFCSSCNVLDEYTAVPEDIATAIVEGVMVPENEFGSSNIAYLQDAFVWEMYEAAQ